MRIVHWTLSNASGLNRMACQISEAEKALGLDSVVCYTDDGGGPSSPGCQFTVIPKEQALTADIHVMHSWIPPEAKGKRVFFAHGTPEHCFHTAVEQGVRDFNAGDSLMLSYYNIDHMEVTATFWPRHQYIWQNFNPKAIVRTIPMGVKKDHWHPVASKGKYAGDPSLFMAENCHTIKWPLDIILAWPYIMREHMTATLHIHYIPHNLHRYFYPLMSKSGVSYRSYTSATYFGQTDLRNAFVSTSYYLSLVRYGDFNTISMEAKASGCKVISYRGNPYADYWITEGDQRTMAQELLAIFSGKTPERATAEVPDIKETAEAMKKIYEEVA